MFRPCFFFKMIIICHQIEEPPINSNTQLTISGLSSHSLSLSFEYGLVGDDASISSRLEFASFSSMPYQLAVIASMYVCMNHL